MCVRARAHVCVCVCISVPNRVIIEIVVVLVDSHLCMTLCVFADAAEVLRQNRRLFEQNVAKSMRGGFIGSVYFERCLK